MIKAHLRVKHPLFSDFTAAWVKIGRTDFKNLCCAQHIDTTAKAALWADAIARVGVRMCARVCVCVSRLTTVVSVLSID